MSVRNSGQFASPEAMHSLETADTLLLSSSLIYSLFNANEEWLLDVPVAKTVTTSILTQLFLPSVFIAFQDEARDTRLQLLLQFGQHIAAARPVTIQDVLAQVDTMQVLALEGEQSFLSRIILLHSKKISSDHAAFENEFANPITVSTPCTFFLTTRKDVAISYLDIDNGKRRIINLNTLYESNAVLLTQSLVQLCVSRAIQKDLVQFRSDLEREQEFHLLYKPFDTLLQQVLASSDSLSKTNPVEQLYCALLHFYTITWDEKKESFGMLSNEFVIRLLAGDKDDTAGYLNQMNCIDHFQSCFAFPPEKQKFFSLLRKFSQFMRVSTIPDVHFHTEARGTQSLQQILTDPSLYVPELLSEEESVDQRERMVIGLLQDLRSCPAEDIQNRYDQIVRLLQLSYGHNALSFTFIESTMHHMYELNDKTAADASFQNLTEFLFEQASIYFPTISLSLQFGYKEGLALSALRVFDPDGSKAFAQKMISSILESIGKDIEKREVGLEEGLEDRAARRMQLQEATSISENLISADTLQLLFAFHKNYWIDQFGDVLVEKFNFLYGLYTLYVSGIISPQILSLLVKEFLYQNESEDFQRDVIEIIYSLSAKTESEEKKVVQRFLLQAYQP